MQGGNGSERKPLAVLRRIGNGKLNNEIDPHAQSHLRSRPFIDDGGFAALQKMPAHHSDAGIGVCHFFRALKMIGMSVMQRVVLHDNAHDVQRNHLDCDVPIMEVEIHYISSRRLLTNVGQIAIITFVANGVNMLDLHLNEVEDLGGKPLALSETLDLHRVLKRKNADLVSVSPIAFDGEAEYLAGLYTVNGTISGEVTVSCSRCLKEVRYPLALSFDESFIPQDSEIELEDDGDIHRVDEETVTLDPYIEEEILLNLPYVPLCDEACKGLCPECGKDRNETDCGCRTERIDPRLADLAKFFEQE